MRFDNTASDAPMPQASGFLSAPIRSAPIKIGGDWIDYNSHLSMAYYHMLFDRVMDEVLALLTYGKGSVAFRNTSIFMAESHSRYLREVALGEDVAIETQMLGFTEKAIHFHQTMRRVSDEETIATSESINLHVDLAERRAAPFPPDAVHLIADLDRAHRGLRAPDGSGKVTLRR